MLLILFTSQHLVAGGREDVVHPGGGEVAYGFCPMWVVKSSYTNLFHMSKLIGWEWIEPFVFTWHFSQDHRISIPLLNIPEAYFHHLIRLAINRMLWSKASSSRKKLRGVHVGIDKEKIAWCACWDRQGFHSQTVKLTCAVALR